MAKPYLSEGLVDSSQAGDRLVWITTVSNKGKSPTCTTTAQVSPHSKEPCALNRPEESDKTSDRKELSPRYQRAVGSPGYDRLGADGKFVKSGSLDAVPDNFPFDSDRGLAEDSHSSKSELEATTGHEFLEARHCGQHLDLSDSDEPCNRLSIPLFGSAPRLHSPPSSRITMKQNSQYNNVQQFHRKSREPPIFHRRSASHDEQTLNFIRRQQCSPNVDYRAQFNPTKTQNSLDITRGARTGQNVRFHGHSNQSWEGPRFNEGGCAAPNDVAFHRANSHTEVKSSSSAQELRNAYIRHQLALRSQKAAGLSQRPYNSNEELPLRDYSSLPIPQNGLMSHARPAQLEKNLVGGVVVDVDDEDDLQQSGYGVGFRRANSLGKADTLKLNRNQDFIYSDIVHRNQYTNRDDPTRGLQITRLSPALQQRLRNVTSSMGVMSSTNHSTTSKGHLPCDFSYRQNDQHQATSLNQREEHYRYSPNSAQINEFTRYSGEYVRDDEDGMVHSRYEHGKSLAVPTQQFPEGYFGSTAGESPELNDRKRSSFSSRHSAGSRLSETAANLEMTSNNIVPNDLKTIDATDLATRLFTLDGFTSNEVAPFLGKK